MLKISLLEFFLRAIPETFLMVLIVHALSRMKINFKKYLLSSSIFSVMVYLIRLLPIQLGVHSILNLIVLIVLTVLINKVDIIKSTSSGLIAFIFTFLLEGANFYFIQSVLKKDINEVMTNPVSKVLTGLPSLILFGIFTIIYYIILLKQNKLR
ncbi:hypothetical protein M2651_04350 [Clostridium sp. SYSU_GA19001]|uniref:hypothetical protein n=1 Tax=Clostridium caldaquaticum TaxID=2940653 RepID=UPI00207776EF|nr:hypothetical protein [Clostridium caldaquaticum]MCM8710256.1 hypothetical protein [Clostridium caldaquaticum]